MNRDSESEVTTPRYSDNCRREPSWHHDPPSPGARPPGEDAFPRTYTLGPLTPHVPSSAHGHGYPGAPCRSLERAGANRRRHLKRGLVCALRNMSGNAGAAAPRNGLAVKLSEKRRKNVGTAGTTGRRQVPMTIPEKAAAGAGARGRLWLPHAVVPRWSVARWTAHYGAYRCPVVAGLQIGPGERTKYEKIRENCPAVATIGCFSRPQPF